MPNEEARFQLFVMNIGTNHLLTEANIRDLAGLTAGYSGCDIINLINDAYMRAVSELHRATAFKLFKTESKEENTVEEFYLPHFGEEGEGVIVKKTFAEMTSENVKLRKITMVGFLCLDNSISRSNLESRLTLERVLKM